MTEPGVTAFYRGWHLTNAALVDAVERLTAEQLTVDIRPDWPIWASVSHVAGARFFWLCDVFKEPGREQTPFASLDLLAAGGWEDDLAHPRRADELVDALRSTWRICERVLETWTPDTLERTARRVGGDGVARLHTRQSVLMRMITHDAFHAGEISHTLGAHNIGGGGPNGPIDLWAGLSHTEGPKRA